MYRPKLEKDIRCPLEYALDIFGSKWTSRILCVLAHTQPIRYSELRKQLCNITDAVLSASLRSLRTHQLISRTTYDEIPPRVEYTLTERGESVIPLLQSICSWAGIFYDETHNDTLPLCAHCDHPH